LTFKSTSAKNSNGHGDVILSRALMSCRALPKPHAVAEGGIASDTPGD